MIVNNLQILKTILLSLNMLLLLLFFLLILILSQNANSVIRFLNDGDLGQDSCLELSFLLVVGCLADVFDLEPGVIEQVLR